MFDTANDMSTAKIPTRNQKQEIGIALWFGWFSSRIAVLSSKEFGLNKEDLCEQWLVPIKNLCVDLTTCVFVKEYEK